MTLSVIKRLAVPLLLAVMLPGLAMAAELRSVRPEKVGLSAERLQRITPVMSEFVEDGRVAGIVTLVARKGRIAHFDAVGMQDVERQLPMRTDSIFRIYSMTKPVTALAVMILFEKGRFLLDDPVSRYLPEFEKLRVYQGTDKQGRIVTVPAKSPITIHQLLTHTSGLTYGFLRNPVAPQYREAGVSAGPGPQASLSNQETVEKLARIPLLAEPGSGWYYGMSIDVLGRLVEVVSGQSLGEFMGERIFQPLDMRDTGFFVPEDKLSRFTANYWRGTGARPVLRDDPQASDYGAPPVFESGGAGLVSTARDYLRFAQMLLDGGKLGKVRILGRKMAQFMISDHLAPGLEIDSGNFAVGRLRPGPGVGFGLAGSVINEPAQLGLPISRGVYGWAGAASTNFWIDPEEQMVGLVLAQLMPVNSYPLRALMQVLSYQALED